MKTIDEIALEVAGETDFESVNWHCDFAHRLLAAMKEEMGPVGYIDGRGRYFYADDPLYRDRHDGMPAVYTLEEWK